MGAREFLYRSYESRSINPMIINVSEIAHVHTSSVLTQQSSLSSWLYLCAAAAAMLDTHQSQQPCSSTGQFSSVLGPLCFSLSGLFLHLEACVHVCPGMCIWVSVWGGRECFLCELYWKARRNMSTTLMMMSSIMMRNTTTFWVSGGRLQRSMVLKNPILCLLHLPEPLPRAISSLASSSSSSPAPPPLPRRLSLSAEPPHHTAPPRPPPRLSRSLSSSVALLFLSALAVASSPFPATLPMPRVAPACQWRLGAYLCQRLCESAHCEAICVLRAEHPPSSFTPLLLFEKQAPPLFFFLLSSTSIVSLLLQFFYFLSQSGCQDERWRKDKMLHTVSPVHAHASSSLPSSSFYPSIVLFSSLFFSHSSLHSLSCFYLANLPTISSPYLYCFLLYLCVSAHLFSRLRAPAKMVLSILPEAVLPQSSI